VPDSGGVVRRVPLLYPVEDPDTGEIRYASSLALRSLLAYWKLQPRDFQASGTGLPSLSAVAGKEIVLRTATWFKRIPIDDQFRLLINARSRFLDTGAKPYADVTRYGMELVPELKSRDVPASVLEERSSEARRIYDYLHGKIILVAQAFTGSGDIGSFPLEENTPNAMAHFYAMDNILRDDYLRDLSCGWQAFVCLVLAGLAVVCYWKLGTFKANVVLIFVLLLYPLLVIVSADHFGQVLPLIAPLLLLGVLLAANNFYVYLTEEKEKRQVRKMFSTMVSPHVLQLMDENPEAFALRGKKTEATMFFSDLAGFTSISEKVSAEALSALLNRYLTPMTDIILESDGYLDKYSGDGIMAVWGVPFPDKDHAVKACRAALLQQKKVRILADAVRTELGIEISVRMGMNSGKVSAGNMGSERKFQYTVMGDAVNLAARLEPVNKDYGTDIIIGHDTHVFLKESNLITRCLDKMIVKGKTEPVLIYELIGETITGEKVPEWIVTYETALSHFWRREWEEAEDFFRKTLDLHEDIAARLMLKRVDFYRTHPPEEGWTGAFVRLAKD
jgi:adenylate cyclase